VEQSYAQNSLAGHIPYHQAVNNAAIQQNPAGLHQNTPPMTMSNRIPNDQIMMPAGSSRKMMSTGIGRNIASGLQRASSSLRPAKRGREEYELDPSIPSLPSMYGANQMIRDTYARRDNMPKDMTSGRDSSNLPISSRPAKKAKKASKKKTASVSDDPASANSPAAVQIPPTAALRMAALKALHDPMDNNVAGDMSLAEAEEVFYNIVPLQVTNDDFNQVQLDRPVWIQRIVDAIGGDWAEKADVSFDAALQHKWEEWQVKYFIETMNDLKKKASVPRFGEICATMLFEAVMEVHNPNLNPIYGPRKVGSASADETLRCSARMWGVVDAVKAITIVRHDVVTGQRHHELAAAPLSFAHRKQYNK
jgi:hypothetical protein